MAKKNSTHIRTWKNDKEKFKDYCKALGTTSPELFNKLINSEKVNLNKRVIEELKKKEESLKRRAGL